MTKELLAEYFEMNDEESFCKRYEINNGHTQPCIRTLSVGANHYECWAVWIDTTYVASIKTLKQLKILWKGITNQALIKKTNNI